MPGRLSSSDPSTNWPHAYAWLKAEANRLGWMVAEVDEDGRRITGRVLFILGPLDGNMVQVRTNDGFGFEIAEGEGQRPVIFLRRENWSRSFLVYHEYEFHHEAVYSMHVLLGSVSETEAGNSGFVDELGRMMETFSWWGVLLRRELRTYERGDPRRVEIRRILKGWRI